jgi:hypothetical protein
MFWALWATNISLAMPTDNRPFLLLISELALNPPAVAGG